MGGQCPFDCVPQIKVYWYILVGWARNAECSLEALRPIARLTQRRVVNVKHPPPSLSKSSYQQYKLPSPKVIFPPKII